MPEIWLTVLNVSKEVEFGLFTTVFFLATFKLMFAPFTGYALGLSFWETFLASALGGSLSASIFFFFSELLIEVNRKRQLRKDKNMKQHKSTRTKRLIIKVKQIFGIYGICMGAPLFLSIPIGSIVAAKFFSKEPRAFPLIILGIVLNTLMLSTLAYIALG